jgi:hypothetical protein
MRRKRRPDEFALDSMKLNRYPESLQISSRIHLLHSVLSRLHLDIKPTSQGSSLQFLSHALLYQTTAVKS